jgi:hypothetical protein
MLKSITTAVVGAALLVGAQATSEAGHGRCSRGGSSYYAAPAYPAAATYQAAAPGYRSFSYQPGSYQPGASAYRGSTMRSYSGRASYENATSKALGRVGN